MNFKGYISRTGSPRKQGGPSTNSRMSLLAQPEDTKQLPASRMSNAYQCWNPERNCEQRPSSPVQSVNQPMPDSAERNDQRRGSEDAKLQSTSERPASTASEVYSPPSSIREEQREVLQPQQVKTSLGHSISGFLRRRNGDRPAVTSSSSVRLAVGGSGRQERTKVWREETDVGRSLSSIPFGRNVRLPVTSSSTRLAVTSSGRRERPKFQGKKIGVGRSLSRVLLKRTPTPPMTTLSSTQLTMAGHIPQLAHLNAIQYEGEDRGDRPAISEPRANQVGIDKEDQEQIAPHGRCVGITAPPFMRGASTSSLISKEPPYSQTAHSEETDPSVTTPLHAEDWKANSEDAKDAEQTPRESEEIAKLRTQIAELQMRCEAQSRDLENSNSFLNATDKSSDSDVINALQRLNAEAQQSTTYMADCLADCFEFHNMTTNPTDEQISAMQTASETVGDVLVRSLGTRPPEYIPMLVQIAFQAYLASALGQTVSSWVFEPTNNKFISAIYQSLRAAEAQAVSGRWRSLARVHIIHSWVCHPDDLVSGIISGFSDILLAAGCTAPRSDIVTQMTSKFAPKIILLVELAVRLNKLFDEIISSDFEILIVRPGDKFERGDMEDTDGDQGGVQDALVLCATHLGLIKRMPAGTLWEKGKKQRVMVLKPKVLLESFLDTED